MTGSVIEHWLVAVARAAGLPGVDALHVDSSTPAAEAWSLVAMAARVEPGELAERVAAHFRLPLADLQDRDRHAEKPLPGPVARRLHVLPLRYTDRTLVVASADPVGMEAERELTALAGRSIHPEIATPADIERAIAAVYPEERGQSHELPRLLPEDRGGPHVLVVDDDVDARALLRDALEGRGFRVSEAADGKDRWPRSSVATMPSTWSHWTCRCASCTASRRSNACADPCARRTSR